MLAIARERGKVTGWQIFLTVCFLQAAARGEKFRQHDHVKQTHDSDQEIDNKGETETFFSWVSVFNVFYVADLKAIFSLFNSNNV